MCCVTLGMCWHTRVRELKSPGVEMPEFKGFASFGDSVLGALGQVSGAARAGMQEKNDLTQSANRTS